MEIPTNQQTGMPMDPAFRPFRSVLYVPASNNRGMEKAKDLPEDAVIFDLEDAVAADVKPAARDQLADMLAGGGYGGRVCLVRTNGLDTPWGQDDLRVFGQADVDGILVPKVESTADLDALADLCPNVPLWAMMETPKAILNAVHIAAHPKLAGLIMGTNDLAHDLHSRSRPDRMPLLAALQMCLLAARAAGVVCIDGVYNAFTDKDGLRQECRQGRDLGFDGKTLIHPSQIDAANEMFGPSEVEVAFARRQIEAFDFAFANGKGVAVLDGQIVENLHIETAKALIAKNAAIVAARKD